MKSNNKNKKTMQQLLFKNVFKNVFKTKIQLIILTTLVLLSTAIFSVISLANTRITEGYDNFTQQSNLHDFIVDFHDTTNKINDTNIKNIYTDEILKQADLQTITINNHFTDNTNQPGFIINRVETRLFNLQNGTKTIKVIGWNKTQTIDKLVIFAGKPLTDDSADLHGVVINKQFADNNNIKLGDIIRLNNDNYGENVLVKNDKGISGQVASSYTGGNNINAFNNWFATTRFVHLNWFLVQGFGSSADMTTPILNSTNVLPDKTNQTIAYINQSYMGLSIDSKSFKPVKDEPPLYKFHDRKYY